MEFCLIRLVFNGDDLHLTSALKCRNIWEKYWFSMRFPGNFNSWIEVEMMCIRHVWHKFNEHKSIFVSHLGWSYFMDSCRFFFPIARFGLVVLPLNWTLKIHCPSGSHTWWTFRNNDAKTTEIIYKPEQQSGGRESSVHAPAIGQLSQSLGLMALTQVSVYQRQNSKFSAFFLIQSISLPEMFLPCFAIRNLGRFVFSECLMSNVKIPTICLIVRDAKFPCLSRIEFLEFLMAAGATSKRTRSSTMSPAFCAAVAKTKYHLHSKLRNCSP